MPLLHETTKKEADTEGITQRQKHVLTMILSGQVKEL